MTASEFQRTILGLLRREPFEPFTIELTDGRVIQVSNPEEIATNGGAAGWGQATGEIILFDHRVTSRIREAVPTS